jgi:hypothetical protein
VSRGQRNESPTVVNFGFPEKKTQTLIYASREIILEAKAEKTKYMLLSGHQNAGQNHHIKTVNRSFENVSQFKYVETTVINQYFIEEKIKRRLNSGNACYHSVQNLLSCRLLSKNVKIICLWFCMGVKLDL